MTKQIISHFLHKALFLVAILITQDASFAESPLRLSCEPVKADYTLGEPYLLRCHFTNTGEQALTVELGFRRIRSLRFGFMGGDMAQNKFYPSGGLDFGDQNVTLKAGKTYTMILSLNGWLQPKIGMSTIQCQYLAKGDIAAKCAFTIHVSPANEGDRLQKMDQMTLSVATEVNQGQISDAQLALASACKQEPRNAQLIEELLKTPDLPAVQKEFLAGVRRHLSNSWDAID